MIEQIIIDFARYWVGKKELPGNSGWEDPKLTALMEAVGWNKGEAWCSYYTELVWKMAYALFNPKILIKLDSLFSAGAVATYNRFLNDGTFTVDKHCTPGSIAIFQRWINGERFWQGHAVIVTGNVVNHEFPTIEGNSNSSGGREGVEVAIGKRLLNFETKNGLVLKGFIHPINPNDFKEI